MKKLVLLCVALTFTLMLFAQEQGKPLNLLVFSKTKGFRHESISSGLKMIFDLSKKQNWVVTATEDATLFTDDFLKRFDVAIFLNPTQDALDEEQQSAFERFMTGKKGFVGIHAAADFEYDWGWYGKLIGAYFKTHPASQEATVIIENTDHPSMKPFKGMESYTTFDEWYTFKVNPRHNVNVLASLDESSIKKFDNDNWKMGDHPLVWWQEFNGIRSFYTGFGHTHEAFQDKKIIEHIQNAINWAGRRTD